MKYFKSILVFIGLSILIIQTCLLKMQKNDYDKLTHEVKNKLKIDSITIAQLSGRIELMYSNDQFSINEKTTLIRERGDSILLKDIPFEDLLFVIRFSEFNCMSCISSEMEKVSKFIEPNNTLCLATYSQLNDLVVTKKLLRLSEPVYKIPFNAFKNTIEQKKMPYYFVLDKDYQISHLFVADPNNHKMTEKYLKYIATIIKKNKQE